MKEKAKELEEEAQRRYAQQKQPDCK